MALRVRVYQVTWMKETRRWQVYTGLYDDANNPENDIAKRVFNYTTAYTEAQIHTAVINAYQPSANAYAKRNEIKASLEVSVSDIVITPST